MRRLLSAVSVAAALAACGPRGDDGVRACRPAAPTATRVPVPRRVRASPPDGDGAVVRQAATPGPTAPASPAPCRVVGEVVDESGVAVADAEVSLPRWIASGVHGTCYGGLARWTRVGPDGAIDWSASDDRFPPVPPEDPPPGGPNGRPERLERVVVRAPGFVPHLGPWLRIEDGAVREVGTIRLARGESIAGRACDESDVAAEDVSVLLLPDADEVSEGWAAAHGGPLAARTDAAGRFVFDGLAPGGYRVHCDVAHAPAPLVVSSGVRDVALVVPRADLPRHVEVDVVVRDPTGAEFAGPAGLSLVAEDGQKTHVRIHDGLASASLDAAGRVDLRVRDWETDETRTVEGVVPRGEPYVVTLGLGPTIRGRVVLDSGGTSCDWGDARVTAEPCPADGTFAGAHVRDDGTFVVAVPREGLWRLTVHDGPFQPPTSVSARAGDTDVVVRVSSPEAAQALAFAPVLPDGRAAAGIFARAFDATGEFDVAQSASTGPAFVGLPPGRTWRLTVRVRDDLGAWYGPATLDGLATARPPVEVVLEPSPTVEGVVVRRDGSPVVCADVRAWCAGADWVAEARTGLDGRFVLSGLALGTWRVTAATDALETAQPAAVPAGSRDVRIVAAPRRAPF